MMGGAVLAPALEELRGRRRELQAGVGVADPERLARDRLPLGHDQLQPAVRGLRAADDRDRPGADRELDAQAGATLAVEELERAQRGPLVRDRDVARAVVTHEDEVLIEVEGVELGERAARAEAVEQ